MSKKYVYQFSEGNASMRNLLGGKGANLAEMTKIGLPVPQGFTISTEACTQYYEGIGIARSEMKTIFNRFERAAEHERDARKTRGGFGIGLNYGCDGYHRLSIGGRENLRLLSGYDLVSIDLLSGALSGDGKRA